MHPSFHSSCSSPRNAEVWRAYLEMESRHRSGGFDLFEALAKQLGMPMEAVVEIVYHCGECIERRHCQAASQAPALP